MRKIALYGIILFQIGLIGSLVRGIQMSRRSSTRIAELEEMRDKLVAEREKLDREKDYVQSAYYLEKVARDELHLAKPGETVVIIPDDKIQIPVSTEKPIVKEQKPNWQKWWGVLSGRI